MTRGALMLALSLFACSDDRGTCAVISSGVLHACVEYGETIPKADAERSCERGGGTWQDESCDDAGAVARCDAFGSSTTYYDAYVESGVTIDQLRETCLQTTGEFTEL